MNYLYILYILLQAIILTAFFTYLIKKVALKLKITDKPDLKRKIHGSETPLLGGIAIFLTFFILLFLNRTQMLSGNLEPHHWLGVFIGALILIIGGFLDDKYNLKPGWQIIFPLLASLAVVAGGVGIEKITNPLGGYLYLDIIKIPILHLNNSTNYFVVLSDLLIIFWLMGMMYTTKLLDGVDGLVSGIVAIGSFIIFLFTMTTKYFQPDIGFASLVLAGSCLGFLIFNWHPAKIFLGEGGSLLLGFLLGVLAIISGGKIAIALLIMGIPILDVFWTITRRLAKGKNPFKFADRGHLHFRLLDSGIGPKKTVLIYYFLSLVFGLAALSLQSQGKLIALIILIIIMFLIVLSFRFTDRKNTNI